MMLLIRMALYFLSAAMTGNGWANAEAGAGLLGSDFEVLAQMIGGALTFLGTFWASRVAKARGGKT